MRVLVQKALQASVSVDGTILGEIDSGLVLLVGFTPSDTEDDVVFLARKVANLRIFPDEAGKMNRSVLQNGGAILSVSQFTLYADTTDGNRPSFTAASRGEEAEPLFLRFNALLAETYGIRVVSGRFGAHMQVRLTNDGPVTILLESRKKRFAEGNSI
jgi:D-tyrosyl-tRNA(Tyr) deacylase